MRRVVLIVTVALTLVVSAAALAETPPGLAAKLHNQKLQVRSALALTNRLLVRCHAGTASTQGGVQPYVRLPVCTKAGQLRTDLIAMLDRLDSGKAAGSQLPTLVSHAQALGAAVQPQVLPAIGGNG